MKNSVHQYTIVQIKIYKFVHFLLDISKYPDVIQKNGSDIWNQNVLNIYNPLLHEKIKIVFVAQCYYLFI